MNAPLILNRSGRWDQLIASHWCAPTAAPLAAALLRARRSSYLFRDQRGILRLIVTLYTTTILSGYATDGCSWVPDRRRARFACYRHDATRQAANTCSDCPWSRNQSDDALAWDLDFFKAEFTARLFYPTGLALFGGFYSLLKGITPPHCPHPCPRCNP